MRIAKKSLITAVAVTSVVALGGGAAFAYFTAGGSGTGNAPVGTSTPFTVAVLTSLSTPSTPLLPGSGTYNFTYRVKNTSAAAQQLSNVVVTMDFDGNGDNGATDCKAIWFTPTIVGFAPSLVAPGPAGAYVGSGTVVMPALNTNQDACKGTTPSFTVTAS